MMASSMTLDMLLVKWFLPIIIQLSDVPHQPAYQAGYAAYGEDEYGALKVDALPYAHQHYGGHAAYKGGDDAGQHHIGRVVGVLRGAVANYRGRYKCEPGGMQAQEHDLRVAGALLIGVQLLQALHGLEAKGGSGGVEAEEVGGEVKHHVRYGRVVGRHLGEDAYEYGAEEPRQLFGRAGIDKQLQYATEEGEVGYQRAAAGRRWYCGR